MEGKQWGKESGRGGCFEIVGENKKKGTASRLLPFKKKSHEGPLTL